jgi:hypothetical protein
VGLVAPPTLPSSDLFSKTKGIKKEKELNKLKAKK